MPQSELIRVSPDRLLHCLTFWGCTPSVLRHALNPGIPFVWMRRHLPQTQISWWNADVPLFLGGRPYNLEVRGLEFDVQMTTERFLTLLPELEEHGMGLFQMNKRVPDALEFHIEDPNINHILILNGLFLNFTLPHANETALLCSPSKEYLKNLLKIPAIRDLTN